VTNWDLTSWQWWDQFILKLLPVSA